MLDTDICNADAIFRTKIHVDAMWCDASGVCVKGYAHAFDVAVQRIYLRSGDRRVDVASRTVRSDLEQSVPGIAAVECGFTVYLACPPFRPVFIGVETIRGVTEVEVEAVLQTDFDDQAIWGPENDPFERFVAAVKAGGGTVVEIGARAVSPGATLRGSRFTPECHFLGVDIHAAPGVDIVADAQALSDHIELGSLDALYSMAVLEHIACPWLFAAEVNRVLRIGGLTFHLLPQSWPVHEMPNDFWRMSDEALKVLFGPATGFEVVEASMSVPTQMILHPHVRYGPYLELPFGRGMAASFIIARKVAEIDPNAVRWPAKPDGLLRQSRTYPLHGAEPDNQLIASDLDFVRLVTVDGDRTAAQAADPEVRDSEAALLQRSSLFDTSWYLATNDDVRASGVDPIVHYLNHGRHEGRRPGPDFDGSAYLRLYPDVARAGADPLIHYLRHGQYEGRRTSDPYPLWLNRHGVLSEDDLTAIRHHRDTLVYRPLISVIVPTFMTQVEHLNAMAESVRAQLYETWELCIVDDGSPDPAISRALRMLAEKDPRIRIAIRPANGGISAASNDALAIATGDFVALLDHDDRLHETALYEVVAALNDEPDTDILFSDSDEIDDIDYRSKPYMKGGWNPELLLGHNLISHLGVYRRALVERIGGFRAAFDGSQDYDLCLRASAATSRARIRHIPAVLYHWRRTRAVASFSQTRHAQCIAAAHRAIGDHLRRTEPGAMAIPNRKVPMWTRIVYPIPTPAPLVSLLVHSDDVIELERLIEGVSRRTHYRHREILIAVDDGQAPNLQLRALAYETTGEARVVWTRGVSSRARRLNRAAAHARGGVLVLLSGRTDVITPQWLDELVAQAARPHVGAVGPLVRSRDNMIEEAGLVLGNQGGRPHLGADSPGYFGHFALAREVSAVSEVCLALRREIFAEVGGLRDVGLSSHFLGLDLCMRLRRAGKSIIWTPAAEVFHFESRVGPGDFKSDADEAEDRAFMDVEWGSTWLIDPFYSPNLSLDVPHELAEPPRRVVPWSKVKRELWIRAGQRERAARLLAGVARSDRIIEIGASYSPIAPKSEGWRSSIVDHATRDQLVAKYANEPDVWPDRIEDVDFLWTRGTLADAVPEDQHGSFDVLVASHMIEHTPDFIGFLNAAGILLRPSGIMILAIPDKRYCFDYIRPLTSTGPVVEAHRQGRTRHNRATAFDHHTMTMMKDNAGAWGQESVNELRFVNEFDDALCKMAKFDATSADTYQDFHAWHFTPSSFKLILIELARLGLTDWRIDDITPAMGCEFHVRLRRGGHEIAALSEAQFSSLRLRCVKGIVYEMREQIALAQAWLDGAVH